MTRRGIGAKEVGSEVRGGATTCIFHAGTNQASYRGRKYKEILREARNTEIDHCPPG